MLILCGMTVMRLNFPSGLVQLLLLLPVAFVLAFCAASARSAQAPQFNWVTAETGGTTNDTGSALTVDSGGNSYLTADFESRTMRLGPFTITNYLTNAVATNENIFMAKLDPAGRVLWATPAGGASNDAIDSIAIDAAGNSYITGVLTSTNASFGTITVTNTTNKMGNPFIARLNASGVPQWVAQGTATMGAVGSAITVDASGHGYLLGLFAGTLSIAGTNLVSSGENYFMVRFDSAGDLSGAIQFGGGNLVQTELDRGGIGLDSASNIYVGAAFSGITSAFGTNTLTNYSTNGNSAVMAFMKFDTNENYVWLRQCGGNGVANVNATAVDASGNMYFSGDCQGSTNFFGSIMLTTNTGDRVYGKMDNSGNVLWVRQAIVTGPFNSSAVHVSAITADAAGNSFIAGVSETTNFSFGAVAVTNLPGTNEGFVYAFDTNGNALWARGLDGTNLVSGMAMDLRGNNYIAGWTRGTVNFDSHTVVSSNFDQAFIASLGPPPPALAITPSGNKVLLSWPTNILSYSLFTETNLLTPGWTAVSGPVGVAGSNYVVTNAISNGTHFYRLELP